MSKLMMSSQVMIFIGAASCGLGLYASALEIAHNGASGKPFACADNSPLEHKQFVNGTTPLPGKL